MPEFIPLHSAIHFKCAFDISAPDVPNIMTHLRRTFRRWCNEKVNSNDPVLLRTWFFKGNSPDYDPAQYVIGDFQLRTISAPGVEPDEPSCWALEMIHYDLEERARRWSVEITLRRMDDGFVRFTTLTKHWMMHNYIGAYPPPPAVSAPAYVRQLIGDRNLTCRKGSEVLKGHPIIVSQENCRSAYNDLISNERQAPVVVMACDEQSQRVLVSPVRVVASVIGNANVYVLPNLDVVDEMNYYLGDLHRCEQGAVRVYQPKVSRLDPVNARQHRYLAANTIVQQGEDNTLQYLANGIARNGSTFRRSDYTSFNDIVSERRKHAIKRLAAESQGRTDEVAMLLEANEKLASDAALWEAAATQYESENASLGSENASLRSRVEEANRVRHRIKDLESQAGGVRQMTTLPTTLSEILTTVARQFPDRIEIAENAIATANQYAKECAGYWGRPEQLSIAWELVHGVAVTLHDLVFLDKSKKLEVDFGLRFSSFELALTEGKKTNESPRFRKLRRVFHGGREIDITKHIKYGNIEPRVLRLYFAISHESKRLIVGHFGGHLENYSARKSG